VRLARCLLLTSLLFLAHPLLAAVEKFEIHTDSDTAYLPYGTSVWNLDPIAQQRKPILHPLLVVSEATADSPTGSYLFTYNPELTDDVPSHLSWNRFPSQVVMKEKPLGPILSDVAALLQHDSLFVICTSFRRDSAWFYRYRTSTGEVDSLFAATGVDRTGDGVWHGYFEHFLTSDYDYDGHQEMFFYLDPVRDKSPRLLFCVDPITFTIEWKILIASPPTGVLDCRDSLNPGVILATGPRGQGGLDSLFDDSHGYLIRVDSHGKVVFSIEKSVYPDYVGLRPGISSGSFFVDYRSVAGQVPGEDSALSHFEEVDANGVVLHEYKDTSFVSRYWKADFHDDGKDDIFVSYTNGKIRILNDSLIPIAEADLGFSPECIASVPRFDGRRSVIALSEPSSTVGLYDERLTKLVQLPACNNIEVLQRGSKGEVLALAANDAVGGPRIIILNKRGLWNYVAIFYRRYQLYVLVGMFTLLAALVVSNFYRRRARRDFTIISQQREDLEKTHEELKKAQQTIIAQEKFRQAKDIAGGFAHEIKNALFPADGALIKQERLLQDPVPDFDRLKTTHLTIRGAMARAISLTRLIMTYTKLDAEVIKEFVNLSAVLEDVLRANSALIEVRHLTLVKSGPVEITTSVNAEHLRSVLTNLLVNSIDALGDRPDPTIRIVWALRDEQIVLDWSDNGCGIAEANLPRVFDAFFSTKPTTGTGLGLSFTKKIVELYGGSIAAESRQGEGTTFHLKLPIFEG
jgi:signal transduction histidine kinase